MRADPVTTPRLDVPHLCALPCHVFLDRLNAHVDARLALDAPGRYANDNFDKDRLNARFDKDKVHKRAKLVATRHIRKGEEVSV